MSHKSWSVLGICVAMTLLAAMIGTVIAVGQEGIAGPVKVANTQHASTIFNAPATPSGSLSPTLPTPAPAPRPLVLTAELGDWWVTVPDARRDPVALAIAEALDDFERMWDAHVQGIGDAKLVGEPAPTGMLEQAEAIDDELHRRLANVLSTDAHRTFRSSWPGMTIYGLQHIVQQRRAPTDNEQGTFP